jgi:hypothetical protein
MKSDKDIDAKDWKVCFSDDMTGNWHDNWRDNWFLDGELARVTHSATGMDFWADPTAGDDACHAVLWTKRSFTGDIKIEYEFTRLDRALRFVNIIYVQATGSGAPDFPANIAHWAHLRRVPAMRMYFDHMHTYHISYAAYGMQNNDPDNDYIRARRYMPDMQKGLADTDLLPDYFRTGLFATGVKHRITIIKTADELSMAIHSSEKEMLCHWTTAMLPPISKGRIGLRHMYTRGARYHNFRVYC